MFRKALILVTLVSSFPIFANDIHCTIPGNENEILITNDSLIVSSDTQEVVYPKIVANRTYPEIGIISGFKGTYRRGGSSVDYSVMTIRIDQVTDGVAVGVISMSGRDRTLNLKGLKIACDQGVLQFFE